MKTEQTPIQSGFGPASTTAEVIKNIDLKGKNAIVTGGYSGLGLETVKTLVSAAAHVIVPARDLNKARQALAGLDNVEIEYMDLLEPDSIDSFAEKFLATGKPLHILINSAGIMALPKLTLDNRGYEYHFATNHLGHFQLTLRLLPALRKANGARVVMVSSRGHHLSNIFFDDIHFKNRQYTPMLGYAQSKTANVLSAVELDKREKNNNIRAFAVHPGGIVSTNLIRYQNKAQLLEFGVIDEKGNEIIDPENELKTVQQGAATQVWCATSPELNGLGGLYCEDVDVAPLINISNPDEVNGIHSLKNRLIGVMPYAIDPNEAEQLWKISAEMIKDKK
ncbi:MAG: SDR family NAD(P)-dependent oxidoreductase [Sporolactobacillus sp.]